MINKSTIDNILASVQINEVIVDFIPLKNSGHNLVACCPFHNENTPSFTVSPSKGIYTCFGCHKSGNAISFLMQYKNLSFPESIKYLGNKYNVLVEEEETDPEHIIQQNKRDKLYEFNQIVSDYYRDQLIDPNNKYAIQYIESRFSKESISKFQLGFASDNYSALLNEISNKKYTEEFLLSTGLFRRSNKSNKLYDFFRNRIIFPVFDKVGRVISFSGRIIPNLTEAEKYPKYVNLTETLLYKKKETLYGLNFAIQHIIKSKEVILVEGNPDVVKMHEIGVYNVIAPSGTALTKEHIAIIKRMNVDVVFMFDGDMAGQKASEKNGKLTLEAGLNTYLTVLSESEDPETFFKSEEHFNSWYVDNKVDFVLHYSRSILEKSGDDPSKKNKAIADISNLIGLIKKENRLVYMENISEKCNINIRALKDRIKSIEPINRMTEDKGFPSNISISDYEKWGFYEDKNRYYFNTSSGKVMVSNFVMKPLFHIQSNFDSRRIFELINYFGYSVVIDFDMIEMTTLTAFQKNVEGRGNFLFTGSPANFKAIKRKLYEETKTCLEIKNLGWQDEGFFAWSNGIITSNGFQPIDDTGIITVNDQHYFIPAFSKIYKSDISLFKDERKFKFIESNVSLLEWSKLFIEVFGVNAKISIAFWVATLFRDLILHQFNNFPILNLFGPKGSGKSQLAMSLSCLFGQFQTPFNIHNGTKPGLAEHIQLFRNAFAWIDEYKNNIEYDKIETLKSIYDSIGRSRMNIDKGKKKETTSVNAGVILSGQEMPTADVALFSRTIFLQFNKVLFNSDEKNNYDRLKAMERSGLSNLSSLIVKERKYFEENYASDYKLVLADLQNKLSNSQIEDRIIRNMSSIIAAFKTINSKIDFGLSYEDILDIAAEIVYTQNNQISQSNEIGAFWKIFEGLFDEDHVKDGWHFRLVSHVNLTTNNKKYEFSLPKLILKFKFNVICSLYTEHARKQGRKPLPDDTLEYYLRNQKQFLGVQNSVQFKTSKYNNDKREMVTSRQNTSAYCFDYSTLGINMERYDEDSESDLKIKEFPDETITNNSEPDDGLPF